MIGIRPAVASDADVIAAIHSTTWKVVYKGIIHEDILKRMRLELRLDYFESVLGTDKEENC